MNTPILADNGGAMLPKKLPRALPHVWKRFWSLKPHEEFVLGKRRMMKSCVLFLGIFPVCEAFECYTPHGIVHREFVAPWTRVRTNVLIRDARPGGKSSKDAVVQEMEAAEARVDGVTQGDDYTRLPQPHSDNSITGPTS